LLAIGSTLSLRGAVELLRLRNHFDESPLAVAFCFVSSERMQIGV